MNHLFPFSRSTTGKHFLKIYGSTEQSFDSNLKRELIDRILDIGLNLFKEKFTYDIYGVGYEVPKGRGVGLKAFNNRLTKKGYENLEGVFAISDDELTGIMLNSWPCDDLWVPTISFSWKSDHPEDCYEKIFETFHSILDISYAYGYLASKRLDIFDEGKQVNRFFFTTSVRPKDDDWWRETFPGVHSGIVRNLYTINFLNERQMKRLKGLMDLKITRKFGNISLVKLDESTIKRYSKKAREVS